MFYRDCFIKFTTNFYILKYENAFIVDSQNKDSGCFPDLHNTDQF